MPASFLFLYTDYYLVTDRFVLAVLGGLLPFVSAAAVGIPLGRLLGLTGLWIGFGASFWLPCLGGVFFLKHRYPETWPLLLKEEPGDIFNLCFQLTAKEIKTARDRIDEFLKGRNVDLKSCQRTLLSIEETCLLIMEKNAFKNIGEAFVSVRLKDEIRLTILDNGMVFNVTDEDVTVSEINAYVVARLSTLFTDKKSISTLGYNRNTFCLPFT